MSKTYTISFDVKQIDEINTALRIMHNRRDNQHRYLVKKLTLEGDKPKKCKRKTKSYLSIVNDTLQYTETQFIPTKETAFNKDKQEIPLNTYLIPTIPQLPPFITKYEL
jgi:hypothetical protein